MGASNAPFPADVAGVSQHDTFDAFVVMWCCQSLALLPDRQSHQLPDLLVLLVDENVRAPRSALRCVSQGFRFRALPLRMPPHQIVDLWQENCSAVDDARQRFASEQRSRCRVVVERVSVQCQSMAPFACVGDSPSSQRFLVCVCVCVCARGCIKSPFFTS